MLKIRSVENFPKAWMWILRSFEVVCLLPCKLELSKFLNSQTWQVGWTAKIMCGRWNFDQKLKNEHGFIWWYFHVGSWRNIFHLIMRCLSWDLDEKVSHDILWKKKFWSWWKMLWIVKTSEKFDFSYLEKFSHSTNLDGMENLENSS